MNKVCTSCKQEKPVDKFSKHKQGAGGLRPTCKQCCSEAGRAYRVAHTEEIREAHAAYRLANKDAIRASDQRYRQENREREVARGAAWRTANPEKERARGAEYRRRNREKDAARKAQYAKANPNVVRAIAARRRARLKGAGGSHTAADIGRLLKLQRLRCAVCQSSVAESYHVDHIVPLALGGNNSSTNLQLLCPPCNHAKSAKHPVEFMQAKGFLL